MRRQVRLALGASRNVPPREDTPDASGAGSAPTRKSGGDLLACRDAPDLAIQAAYRPTPGLPRGRPLVPGVPRRLPTRPRRRCGDGSLRPRLAPRVPPPGSRPPSVPSSSAALCSAKPLEPRPGLVKGAWPALKRPPAGCPTDCRRHRTASTPRESFRGPRTGLWPLAPPKRRSRPENRVHRSARVANPHRRFRVPEGSLLARPAGRNRQSIPPVIFLCADPGFFHNSSTVPSTDRPLFSSSRRKPGSTFRHLGGGRMDPGFRRDNIIDAGALRYRLRPEAAGN